MTFVPRTRSLVVIADADAPWAPRARLGVAEALVRRSLGAKLRIGPDDPTREAEGTWFGGSVGAYVVYPDTKSGEQVAMMRVLPRDDAE